MANFSQVPGLAGYQQQVALNDQQGAQQMMKLSQLMNMAQARQGMEKGALEMSVMQDKLAREKKIRDALMGQQTGQSAPAAAGGQMGMPGQASPAMGSPAGAGGIGRALAQKINATADIYEQFGDFENAIKYREHAQKLMPELKDEQVRMGPGGKPVVVRNYKDGTTEVSPFAPADKLHFADTGGMAGVGMNPYTGAVQAPGVAKTQSPDSIASNRIAIRGQDLVNARAKEALAAPKPVYNSESQSWITPPVGMAPGQVAPVPGMPPKPLTEFQGKSAGFGARAAVAHEILNSVGNNGAVQPGLIKRAAEAVPLAGEGLGTLTNFTQSAPQQQVEQAQRDFVNAVLRQESGAAISQGEFENAKKQYFPQPGDTPEVVAQKSRNREQAIAGFSTSSGPTGAKAITSAKQKMQTIFEANKAIKQGADREAVKQRLESMGITDHGIK